MKKWPSREELRKRMLQKRSERSSRAKDPDEFRAPKMKGKDKWTAYFRVLPELEKEDKCATGTCEVSSDMWYYENGAHWVGNDKLECPRVHDSEDCPLCSLGWDMLDGETDDDVRKKIFKEYIPRTYFSVNVYFLNIKNNPESVRGKVMWFSMPMTVFKKMDECILNDDEGDELDPKAAGIFYHPYEGYTFKLVVGNKGDWNTYEESSFLPKTFGPLVATKDGKPDEKAIQAILDKRHVLVNKFPARKPEKLQKIVDDKINGGKHDGADQVIDVAGKDRKESEVVVETTAEVTEVAAVVGQEVVSEVSGASSEETENEVIAEVTEPTAEKPKAKAAKKPAIGEEDDELASLLQQIKGA